MTLSPLVTAAVECAEKELDLWFVLDSSSSIYIHDYDRQLAFARNVTARLDVRPLATRVGLMTFSDSFTVSDIATLTNAHKHLYTDAS